MKCPKCGYISFDYHQVCPKCSKDISAEQQKLNLPAFRPEPPSILGGLLGDAAGESGVHMSASTEMAAMHEETQISMTDSSAIDAGELRMDDSQEVDLGLDLEAGGEEEGTQPPASLEEPALDLELEGPSEVELPKDAGKFALPDSEPLSSLEKGEEEAGEEMALDLGDLGDLSSETVESEEKAVLDTISRQEPGELDIDLGDLTAGEPSPSAREPVLDASGEVPLDLDAISSKAEEESGAEEKDEITLNLDDLKVNETGELEIGKTMPSLAQEEKPLEIEGFQLEEKKEFGKPEKKEEEEDFALLLSDEGEAAAPTEGESEEGLDLDNLDLELDLEEADRK